MSCKNSDFITCNSWLYPYEYATASDGKWKGFEAVTPDMFEADSAKIEIVIATVNAISEKILKPDKWKVFRNVLCFGDTLVMMIIIASPTAIFETLSIWLLTDRSMKCFT